MTAPYRPDSTKAFQAENWYWVPADGIGVKSQPELSELQAAGVVELTGYVYTDITRPSRSTNLVARVKRLLDGAQYQQVGQGTYAGGTINFSVDPQAASGGVDRKVWDLFDNDTAVEGFLVRRAGLPVDTALAVGQNVSVYPVEVDAVSEALEGDDDAAETAGATTYAVTAAPALLKAIVTTASSSSSSSSSAA